MSSTDYFIRGITRGDTCMWTVDADGYVKFTSTSTAAFEPPGDGEEPASSCEEYIAAHGGADPCGGGKDAHCVDGLAAAAVSHAASAARRYQSDKRHRATRDYPELACEPVEILQNIFSDRTRCIAQLRPGCSFLLSAPRFFYRYSFEYHRVKVEEGEGVYLMHGVKQRELSALHDVAWKYGTIMGEQKACCPVIGDTYYPCCDNTHCRDGRKNVDETAVDARPIHLCVYHSVPISFFLYMVACTHLLFYSVLLLFDQCGGKTCPRCTAGFECKSGLDCASGKCDRSHVGDLRCTASKPPTPFPSTGEPTETPTATPTLAPAEPTCIDGSINGRETDISNCPSGGKCPGGDDCSAEAGERCGCGGGECPTCQAGQRCDRDYDCDANKHLKCCPPKGTRAGLGACRIDCDADAFELPSLVVDTGFTVTAKSKPEEAGVRSALVETLDIEERYVTGVEVVPSGSESDRRRAVRRLASSAFDVTAKVDMGKGKGYTAAEAVKAKLKVRSIIRNDLEKALKRIVPGFDTFDRNSVTAAHAGAGTTTTSDSTTGTPAAPTCVDNIRNGGEPYARHVTSQKCVLCGWFPVCALACSFPKSRTAAVLFLVDRSTAAARAT